MISTDIQDNLNYSIDTEKTPRIATSQLKQTTVRPHAYVFPVHVLPSENIQSTAAQHIGDALELANSVNDTTTINKFTQFVSEGISGNSENYIHSFEGPLLSNLQTFTSHGGFFLPAGYQLIYAPLGNSQVQSTTPTTPQLESLHDNISPSELQCCSKVIVTNSSDLDQ